MNLQAAFQNFGMPSKRFEELAILNRMQLEDVLEQGMLIKVIGKYYKQKNITSISNTPIILLLFTLGIPKK